MASISFNITHPQLTKTVTITVTDARLLEFVDNLRNHVYGKPGTPPTALTRTQAADKLLADFEAEARRLYKQTKAAANAATLPAPGDIDAA
jgi:hypothetical protein